ncbi:MAG: heparinase II/III family protein [Oceanicaulis sp.]|uniref:heparinase II/III family protein n=1 Tax=Glycocaulis sp. TaxID=1969725 RepID=UPI0025BB5AD5|nr:heparinase II/III family protein [Glycocaulis sp.]MCC5980688.1 heparinase II/III family protein [Oceanicaulis sp.]MCH8520859.1 heparinase II/III family protein [Glycocaulis sp.]
MGALVTSKDMADALGRSVAQEVSAFANMIAPYRLAALSAGTPRGLTHASDTDPAGDAQRGAVLLSGRFTLGGETLNVAPGETVWERPAPSRAFAARLHGFGWLDDLLAVKNAAARETALVLIDDWTAHFGRWNSFAWSPAILARRVRAWLNAGTLLQQESERHATEARFRTLARQCARLSRTLSLLPADAERIEAAITLISAQISLGLPAKMKTRAEKQLVADLKAQVLADGGHVSRTPIATARILASLVRLDALAGDASVSLDGEIHRAMDRLAGAVRFFRLGPKGLASFHGGGEGTTRLIETALRGREKVKPFNVAPHSGYHRAEAGGSVIILDTAGPAKGAHGLNAHASALSFEFAPPGGRLIVNCGWSEDQPASWREAVRATAAHSALTLEETSSARLIRPGWKRDLLGPRFESGPDPVRARRNEEDVGIWLEASHDGYRKAFGVGVRRRVFLAVDGGDLRGEDGIYRPVEDGPPDDPGKLIRFAIRFHLHPGVKASLSRDSLSALLVLPNGDGWRFRTDGGPVRVERSVYLAGGNAPVRSTQLVIIGEAESFGGGDRPPNRVRWAFQRLGRVGGA